MELPVPLPATTPLLLDQVDCDSADNRDRVRQKGNVVVARLNSQLRSPRQVELLRIASLGDL